MNIDFRYVACIFMCLMLCFVCSGCDALYRVLDKEGAEEKELIGEVIPFEKNPVVEEAQVLLYLYGYNTGKIDGILGLRTRNALEKFQNDNALKPTRFIDHQTWDRLNVFKKNKLVVDRKLNIRLVQKLLKEAGFNPGAVDGKTGQRTRAAIKRFQKVHELKVDGKVGYQTLSKLTEFISVGTQVEQ